LKRCAILGFMVLLLCGSLRISASDIPPEVSLFVRTVVQLKTQPVENTSVFASIALSQLAEAYYNEVDLVYNADQDATKKQYRWARAVESFANELVRLNDRIIQGGVSEIKLLPLTEPVIHVDNYFVTLTHPRPDQQAAFEHAILAEYCAQMNCDVVSASVADATSAKAESTKDIAELNWQFAADGANCSYRGLRLKFGREVDFKTVRTRCTVLINEVTKLSSALRWQQQHNVVIEWPKITVSSMQQRNEHSITLNSFGDATVAEVPLLNGSPDLLQAVLPWLRANLNGDALSADINATHYRWPTTP